MNDVHALLLTDIVDSTRLSQAIGDAQMARAWAAHDRVARDLLRTWRGREIDKSDGFLLLFDRAADALGYALDYHRVLAAIDPRLHARAGLHFGAVTLRRNDPADVARGAKALEVDGVAKPLAARVMALAHGGQTLLTAAAREALGPSFAARLTSTATVCPAFTISPALGSCSTTVSGFEFPVGRVALTRKLRPASLMVVSASARSLPTTSGTFTSGLRSER